MTAADIPLAATGNRLEPAQWWWLEAQPGAPESPALISAQGEVISRAALSSAVRAAALFLSDEGIERNERLALAFAPGPHQAAALLAGLAVATVVPLAQTAPAGAVEADLRRLGVTTVLIDHQPSAAVLQAAHALGLRVLTLEPFTLPPAPTSWRQPHPGLEDLALLMQSSGTTSRPKVVPLTHANLLAGARAVVSTLALGPSDRTLAAMPLFHIHGIVATLLAPLLAGGSVICCTERVPDTLLAQLKTLGPTWLSASPTLLLALLDCAERANEPPAHTLRFVRSVTMPLASGARSRLEALFKVPVIEVYGMTEASSQVCSARLPESGVAHRPGTVGPAAGPEVAVLTATGEHCLTGSTGEVAIRGDSVTPGYEGADHSGWTLDERGERWFRTGDQGHLDEQGHLTLTGRIKEMINRGGMKVSPLRVDEALQRHPAVAEALAFALPHATLGEDLMAAVVLRTGATTGEQELRDHLITTLAAHEVPSGIVFVQSLPRGSTGKLQRIGMAGWLADQMPTTSLPIQGDLEQVVASTFAEVLGLSDAGRDANFFLLGGDSLSSISVILRLEQRLGVELSPTLVFSCPSVSTLAHRLEQLLSGAQSVVPKRTLIPVATALPSLRQDGIDSFPASFGQARLWFLHHAEPDSTAYHLIAAWRLRGVLNRVALDQALNALIERHPTLRTSFRLEADSLLQSIHPRPLFQLETDDAGDRTCGQAIDDWLRQEDARPFDLESGLLIRGRLLALGPTEHVLMLNHHHVASDGWSRTVLSDDLVALYNAFCHGTPAALAPLAVHYQDFAAWQRERLQGRRLEELLNYWTRQLDGLEPIALPTDGPRSPSRRRTGASACFAFEPALLARFEALCRSEGATLHMGFLAAVALLLNRISQQEDFSIGVPIWGRNDPSLEPLVGFFVNTLAIRTRFTTQQSFRQLLTQVRDTSIDAYSHQELPFEQIVKALKIGRDASRNPIFQVMLQFIATPVPSLSGMAELASERLHLRPVDARFDLEFFLRRMGDGSVNGELIYDTGLFHAASIDRLIARFFTLFRALINEPEVCTALLDLLPSPERERIETWQVGEGEPRVGRTVDERFAQQVDRTPEAIALVFKNRQLTYAELDWQADCLAQRLAGLSVGPDSIVAVSVAGPIERMVSILAALKAGGAYLPIDPEWPQQRQQDVLHASGATVIITDSDAIAVDSALQLHVVNPSEAAPCAPADRMALRGVSRADSLAYVLYTSGSTGRPKGVAMPHGPLVNLLEWQATCSNGRARTLQFASLGFDVSFQEIFSTWTSGGTLVLVENHIRRDPSALLEMLERDGMERLFLPVVMLDYLAQAAVRSGRYPASLREVFIAGEALRITPDIRQFFERMPGCRLWNHYGPTETHVVTAHLLPDAPSGWPDLPPIGTPITNTRVHVLDPHMQLAPIGTPGDIWIGGAAVARGYWRNPLLTQERFVVDPFDSSPQARLYRTGDRGYWRDDGQLEFIGRTDHQVKIRGHRVELGEVEAVLASHPEVRAAAVVVRGETGTVRTLVGYAVSHSGRALQPGALRAWLQARLPAPMVPAQIMMLSDLPLNANGKVDRTVLERLATTPAGFEHLIVDTGESALPNHPGDQQARDTSRTLLEAEISGIWQRLFNRDHIDLSANFFELGGDSLSAVRMVVALEHALGHRVPLATLLGAPTIESLAQALSSQAWVPAWSSLVAMQPKGSRIPLFVVHGMMGEVFNFAELARALSPEQPVYGIRCKEELRQSGRRLDVEAMAAQYADEIIALRPLGPYVLGGYSLGGWFAYAVATELKRRGATVKLLVFDTYPYCRSPWPAAGAHYLISALKYLRACRDHLGNLVWMKTEDWPRYLAGIPTVRSIAASLSLVPRRLELDRTAADSPPAVNRFIQAAARYSAQSIRSEVALFQATSPRFNLSLRASQAMFWRLLVRGPVTRHPLSCGHLEILASENIPKLAAMVDTLLAPLNDSTLADRSD